LFDQAPMMRAPGSRQARHEECAMAKPSKSRPNKAKSLIAQPLFRCRQERPKKGKGSYRREASQQNWGASVVLAA
jgi:alternative ribosome-rescue factor